MNKQMEKLLLQYEEHCRKVANATTINIAETTKALNDRKSKLEASYGEWFEYYFPHYAKSACAWFHLKAAKILTDNQEAYLEFEGYRSSAKSVHAGMGIPLYLYFTNRLKFMLLVGETAPKANKLLSSIQSEFEYNKRLHNDYTPHYKAGDWATGDFVTKTGARFTALSFGSSPRGIREGADRPDYINVDDVDNKKHVKNSELMTEGVDYITEEIWGCFDEADNAIKRFVYTNNNFHKNSITNRLEKQFRVLIERSREEGQPIVHHILKVKAVKDLVSFIPNWPEKTSADYWRRKYRNTPTRSFLREYMHEHIEDGKVFKASDMQWKKMLPYKEYDALNFYGDLSFKDNACHKGMFLIAKKDREIHIVHSFLRQTSRAKLAKWLYDLYEDKGLKEIPKIRYYIEGLFAMDEFVNDFDTEGDDRGYYIPVTADKRPKGDKDERIEATQPYFERRNVYFNIDEKDTADQIELIDQYLAFEKGSGAAKDGPDAVEGGIGKLNIVTRKAKGFFKFGERRSYKY